MLSAINNVNPSFTSVMPVRVRIDGKESYSEMFIRPACRKLSAILLGPTNNNEKANNIVKTFAKQDPDYKFNYGLSGHPRKNPLKKSKPSDYFRYICRNLEHYFITGVQAEKLKEYGKKVGNEKYAGKVLNVDNSFDIECARGNYWGSMKNYLKNKALRLTEKFNPVTGEKSGSPVSLVIDMKSNGKYGLSTFKMEIDKISFENI